MDDTQNMPAMNLEAFPNGALGTLWSSTPAVETPHRALRLDVQVDGLAASIDRQSNVYLRLVFPNNPRYPDVVAD